MPFNKKINKNRIVKIKNNNGYHPVKISKKFQKK